MELDTHLPCGQAMLNPGSFPKEIKTYPQNIYDGFIHSIQKLQTIQFPSEECINNLQYIHIVEYYLVLKKELELVHMTCWNLENKQHKKSQTRAHTVWCHLYEI